MRKRFALVVFRRVDSLRHGGLRTGKMIAEVDPGQAEVKLANSARESVPRSRVAGTTAAVQPPRAALSIWLPKHYFTIRNKSRPVKSRPGRSALARRSSRRGNSPSRRHLGRPNRSWPCPHADSGKRSSGPLGPRRVGNHQDQGLFVAALSGSGEVPRNLADSSMGIPSPFNYLLSRGGSLGLTRNAEGGIT